MWIYEADFLGHIVTPYGIKPNPKKIEVIANFSIQKNEKQIKQFLGLAGFYLLTICLKKGRIRRNSEYVRALQILQNYLLLPLLLLMQR